MRNYMRQNKSRKTLDLPYSQNSEEILEESGKYNKKAFFIRRLFNDSEKKDNNNAGGEI